MVSNHDDRSDLLEVPVFWPRPTPEPLFNWVTWIGQFFLVITLREFCDPNFFLSEPAEVFDDPPSKTERVIESELTTDTKSCIKRDQEEIGKTNELNSERRKKGPKSGLTPFTTRIDQKVKIAAVLFTRDRGEETFPTKLCSSSQHIIQRFFRTLYKLFEERDKIYC